MSDGFDKEAEREKLREKLSDDDEKREHTQRMSELLLKGATMTNRHCDDCGDPIFRHDGREFCPTCHTVDAADVQDGGPAERGAEASESPDTSRPPEAVDGSEAPPTNAGERSPTVGDSPARSPRNNAAATDEPTGPTTGDSTPPAGASGDRSPPATAASGASPAAAVDSGGVADARASLTRSLHRFAVAAEETDDPRRARDNLQAAREAAEALAALDR
jgi:uncharacterized Zn finger protein (UPF0148 family)